MQPRRWIVAALSTSAALLLVVGAELVARRTLGTSRAFAFETAFPNLAGDELLRTHPRRWFTLAPGFRFTEGHLGRYATTAAWPFRDVPPTPGLARVLFLGDSCVYGTGLDAAGTLPVQTARALAERGVGPDRVQCLNLGVPGYSSVQIRTLLEELLPELAPRAVVVYPAAWNDQGPALGENDLERRAGDAGLRGLVRRSALRRWLAPAAPPADWSEVQRRWSEEGADFDRPRVPAAAQAAEWGALSELCERAGATLLWIAPGHPRETARLHPRTRADAARLLAFAHGRGERALDAEAVFRATGAEDDELFLDFVHPSPRAFEALAVEVAGALAPELAGLASRAAGTLRGLEPRVLPMLGDARLVLGLEPADALGDVVSLAVGGAPCVELAREGPGRWSARVPADSAGVYDVVLRGSAGVLWVPAALERVPPRIEPDAEREHFLVTSRPGDGVRVAVATARAAHPTWRADGARWIAPTDVLFLLTGTCGPDGVARVALPPAAAGFRGSVLTQVAVSPAGLHDEATTLRWGPPVDVRFE